MEIALFSRVTCYDIIYLIGKGHVQLSLESISVTPRQCGHPVASHWHGSGACHSLSVITCHLMSRDYWLAPSLSHPVLFCPGRALPPNAALSLERSADHCCSHGLCLLVELECLLPQWVKCSEIPSKWQIEMFLWVWRKRRLWNLENYMASWVVSN